MLFGITDFGKPYIFFKAQHKRTAHRTIHCFSQKRRFREKLIGNRQGSLLNINYPSHSITSIKQGRRPFQHTDGLYIKSTQFQSMICSPLLPFLFHSVLRYNNPVESHSPDHRFRSTDSDIHCLHTWNISHSLHQVTGKVFPQKVLVCHINRKCRLFHLILPVRFRNNHFR